MGLPRHALQYYWIVDDSLQLEWRIDEKCVVSSIKSPQLDFCFSLQQMLGGYQATPDHNVLSNQQVTRIKGIWSHPNDRSTSDSREFRCRDRRSRSESQHQQLGLGLGLVCLLATREGDI